MSSSEAPAREGEAREREGRLRAALEILFVLALIELFSWWVVRFEKPWRLTFFALSGLAGLPIVFGKVGGRRMSAEDWGVARDGLAAHGLILLPITAAVMGLCFAITEGLEARMGPFLKRAMLYPVWAYAQNLLVLGVLGARLRLLISSYWWRSLLLGLLFAALHVPNWKLTAATLVLGLGFSFLYHWRSTLIIIALCHGLLGACADELLDWNLRTGIRTYAHLLPPGVR